MPTTSNFANNFRSQEKFNQPVFEGFGMTRDPFDLFREFFARSGTDNVMGGAFFDIQETPSARITRIAPTSTSMHVSSTRISGQFVNGKSLTTRRY